MNLATPPTRAVTTILTVAIEATHGLRPALDLRTLLTPALLNHIRVVVRPGPGVHHIVGQGAVRGRALEVSARAHLLDGTVIPIAARLRRDAASGRPVLVEFETPRLRHSTTGPRPAAVVARRRHVPARVGHRR